MKNKYTIMYLKYIYFMLSILKIHINMYVLNKNALRLYNWCINLVYLKSDKSKRLILYLM